MDINELLWTEYERENLDYLELGEEQYNPMKFYREHVVFRPGDFASKVIELTPKTQLPNGSLLHVLDDPFYDTHSDTPRIENIPLITQERFRKFILHIREPQKGLLPLDDKYIYRVAGLPKILMDFKSQHGSMFKYLTLKKQIPAIKTQLTIVNHNPLFRIRILGRLKYFRTVNLILSSLINTVLDYAEGEDHLYTQYIYLPWGTENYTAMEFVRSRTTLDPSSIRYPDSWHYILMMHLVNFMHPKATTSIFSKIPEDKLKEFNIILNSGNKYIFYNLDVLKKLNEGNRAFLKFVNQLNLLAVSSRVTEESSEETKEEASKIFGIGGGPESVLDKVKSVAKSTVSGNTTSNVQVNVVPEIPPTVVETKTEDIPKTASAEETDKIVATKLTRAAKVIPQKPKAPVTTKVSVEPITSQQISQDEISEEVVLSNHNATEIVEIDLKEETYLHDYMNVIDKQADAFINNNERLTPAQKERYKRLAKKYKDLRIGDKTIEDILTEPTDLTLDDSTIDEKQVGFVPDKSALHSSISVFDKSYMKNVFHKHLASTIISFMRNGVFLTDLKVEKEVTELNNLTHYTLKYEDIRGTSSTIKFRFPTVNRDGRIKVDGISKTLKKQRYNLPIVKISDTEVSLASNYNKTRVIRNTTKAHSFFDFINQIVNTGKSSASILYGNTIINEPISYEYCEIAQHYAAIDFKTAEAKCHLFFGYNEREDDFNKTASNAKSIGLSSLEKQYGTYLGTYNDNWLFIDIENNIRGVRFTGGEALTVDLPDHLTDLLLTTVNEGEKVKTQLTEYITCKILDANIPVIFLLGYRFGLRKTLDYFKIDYTITERRSKVIVGESSHAVTGMESLTAKEEHIALKLAKFCAKYLHKLPFIFLSKVFCGWRNTKTPHPVIAKLINKAIKPVANNRLGWRDVTEDPIPNPNITKTQLKKVVATAVKFFDKEKIPYYLNIAGISVHRGSDATIKKIVGTESFGVSSDIVAGNLPGDQIFDGTDWIKFNGQEEAGTEDYTLTTGPLGDFWIGLKDKYYELTSIFRGELDPNVGIAKIPLPTKQECAETPCWEIIKQILFKIAVQEKLASKPKVKMTLDEADKFISKTFEKYVTVNETQILGVKEALEIMRMLCPEHEILKAKDPKEALIQNPPVLFCSGQGVAGAMKGNLCTPYPNAWEREFALRFMKNKITYGVLQDYQAAMSGKYSKEEMELGIRLYITHEERHTRQYRLVREGGTFPWQQMQKEDQYFYYFYQPTEQDARYAEFLELCKFLKITEQQGLEKVSKYITEQNLWRLEGQEIEYYKNISKFFKVKLNALQWNFTGIPGNPNVKQIGSTESLKEMAYGRDEQGTLHHVCTGNRLRDPQGDGGGRWRGDTFQGGISSKRCGIGSWESSEWDWRSNEWDKDTEAWGSLISGTESLIDTDPLKVHNQLAHQAYLLFKDIPFCLVTEYGLYYQNSDPEEPAVSNLVKHMLKEHEQTPFALGVTTEEPIPSKEVSVEKVRELLTKLREIANKKSISFFMVAKGASAISNRNVEIVHKARLVQEEWEHQNGYDPNEDWSLNEELPVTNERRYVPKPNDIAIKFADRVIWINRYPLAHSLIVAGLDYFDTEPYDLADFESKDIYYQLLTDKRMQTNYLKGIDSFFDLFIDPMTFETLKMMHEPTNLRDLFLRCAVLLSTTDYRLPASRVNHKIRGFEQYNAVLYNEMSRQFAAYQTRRGAANSFTMNPNAVFLRVISNASLVTATTVNPLEDFKETSAMTYSGSGGRTAETFVVEDRRFAKDDIGVISEATPDNGKVSLNANLTYDPAIVNSLGVLVNTEEKTPAACMSVHALVFPFSIHDDSKRMKMK